MSRCIASCCGSFAQWQSPDRRRQAAAEVSSRASRTVPPSAACLRKPYLLARCSMRAFCRNTSASSRDRKSTRLNSSHLVISYAVFCLKKKMILKSGVELSYGHGLVDEQRYPAYPLLHAEGVTRLLSDGLSALTCATTAVDFSALLSAV